MDDRDSLPAHYNDGNRAFLQALLARGAMTFKEAQPVLAAILGAQTGRRREAASVTQAEFEAHVSAASAALSAFDLEVRSARHQATGQRVYAVVNTTSDALTQMATLHNAEEIAFVKRVIDAMFDRYNTPRMEVMCLDEMQANKLRRAPPATAAAARPEAPDDEEMQDGDGGEADTTQTQTLRGLKSSEAEAVMRSMVEEGWFERSREGGLGLYGLSARALLELRSWLVESYNDPDAGEGEWQRVKFCEACREIVTVGQRCADRDCPAHLHDICEDAFWRTRGGGGARGGGDGGGNGGGNGGGRQQQQRACPRCGRAWEGRHFKVKKHRDQKAEKEQLAKDKAETPPLPKRPEAFSEGAPVLDREDEKFLESLTQLGAGGDNEDDVDDETPPPLPPRIKTPIFDLDSDSSSSANKERERENDKVKEKEKEKSKDKRTSIDGKPPANRFSFVTNISRSISLKRKPVSTTAKDSSSPTTKPPGLAAESSSLAVPEPELRREESDMAKVLDDLDLSARNNRAFSLSKESAEMARRFTQVLRDLANGVPTAYDDLISLLDDRDGVLARNYEKLPKSLKKLVAQLPEKLTGSLGPEILAAAAEAQGLSAAGAKDGGGGDSGLKGAAKRLLTPKNLRDLVTKPGAIASMLKGIVNVLKTRWPAFMGTNVLWSVAVFLLLSALWYCHKRGREVRLEREASDAAAAGAAAAGDPIDGRQRVEELPDDPQLPAPLPGVGGVRGAVGSSTVVGVSGK
ncbi:RING-like domain-containing protein [Biscogniauxia mediterranea]|nr:RING-like domain-containing protein [Biscogniauxia mediterranea]